MQISNPFYAAAPSLFNAGNPVTTLGAEANGNVEGVTANGVNVTADPGGMIAGFSIADVLTLADKAATGYDPASGKINTLANALASYRANGSLSGVASPSLIDALKSSLAKTGGYPDSPSALIGSAKSAGSNFIRYAQRLDLGARNLRDDAQPPKLRAPKYVRRSP